MHKTTDHARVTSVTMLPVDWIASLEQALLTKQQAAASTPVKKRLDAAAQQLQAAPDANVAAFVNDALSLCKQLYAQGRDIDALPLARLCASLAGRVNRAHYPRLHWQALTATGILLAHKGDYPAAIAEHSRALQLAEATANVADLAFSWNNVGSVFKHASAHSLAIECFMHAYQQYSLGPVLARYCALGNMAYCQLQLGHLRKGRAAATLALRYETEAFRSQDPYTAAVLRNNLVRLLVAADKKEAAQPIAEQVYQLAAAAPSLLMNNLVNVLRAMLDVAYGRINSGIARLEAELQQVRHLPEPRNDTLTALIEAERAAGHTVRAWMYWQELNDYTQPNALVEQGAAINGINAVGSLVTLEPEEYQLLQWLAEGHSSKSMARLRASSAHSIRTYLSRIYAKLGVNNGKAAVAWLLSQRPAADPAPAAPLFLHAAVSPTPTAHSTAAPTGAPPGAWYVQCLAKGYWDTAIRHWQATLPPERPAEARYAVALMLLLQSCTDEAMAEARLLKDTALRGVQWAKQWLATRNQDSLRHLQELAEALPLGHRDKYATLMAIYHGAMRAHAQDTPLAIDCAQALFNEAQALRQGIMGHTPG